VVLELGDEQQSVLMSVVTIWLKQTVKDQIKSLYDSLVTIRSVPVGSLIVGAR
jgi:hypothetical protein